MTTQALLIILIIVVASWLCITIIRSLKGIRRYNRLWLPGWSVIYTDTRNKRLKNKIPGALLKSPRYNLQGKPDYIYKKGDKYVPVELKSADAGKNGLPRDGDVMQLAAYFIIINDAYQTRVRCGYIVYRDCVFKIRSTRRLRRRLFKTAAAMRRMLATGPGALEPSFIKCKKCICRGTVCDGSRS